MVSPSAPRIDGKAVVHYSETPSLDLALLNPYQSSTHGLERITDRGHFRSCIACVGRIDATELDDRMAREIQSGFQRAASSDLLLENRTQRGFGRSEH